MRGGDPSPFTRLECVARSPAWGQATAIAALAVWIGASGRPRWGSVDTCTALGGAPTACNNNANPT